MYLTQIPHWKIMKVSTEKSLWKCKNSHYKMKTFETHLYLKLKGFPHIFEQCEIPFILVSRYEIKLL